MKLFEIAPYYLNEFAAKHAAKENLDLSAFIHRRPETTTEEVGGKTITHIHIFGPLMSNPTPFERALGASSYEDIVFEAKTAADSSAGVILHVDSPGGSVMGAIETARAIASVAEQIPIVAHISGLGCSAAYKLLSASTHVVANESATVGNIGAISVLYDDSERLESLGIKREVFTNDGAELKSTGYGLTEEQREFLQENINAAGETFRSHVLTHREVNEEVFRAGWYSGERAKALGLIDEVGSAETAKERLIELIELR